MERRRLPLHHSTNPHSATLGSSDTLPRSRSLLQTKMATALSKRTSLGSTIPRKNRGPVNSLMGIKVCAFYGDDRIDSRKHAVITVFLFSLDKALPKIDM